MLTWEGAEGVEGDRLAPPALSWTMEGGLCNSVGRVGRVGRFIAQRVAVRNGILTRATVTTLSVSLARFCLNLAPYVIGIGCGTLGAPAPLAYLSCASTLRWNSLSAYSVGASGLALRYSVTGTVVDTSTGYAA